PSSRKVISVASWSVFVIVGRVRRLISNLPQVWQTKSRSAYDMLKIGLTTSALRGHDPPSLGGSFAVAPAAKSYLSGAANFFFVGLRHFKGAESANTTCCITIESAKENGQAVLPICSVATTFLVGSRPSG